MSQNVRAPPQSQSADMKVLGGQTASRVKVQLWFELCVWEGGAENTKTPLPPLWRHAAVWLFFWHFLSFFYQSGGGRWQKSETSQQLWLLHCFSWAACVTWIGNPTLVAKRSKVQFLMLPKHNEWAPPPPHPPPVCFSSTVPLSSLSRWKKLIMQPSEITSGFLRVTVEAKRVDSQSVCQTEMLHPELHFTSESAGKCWTCEHTRDIFERVCVRFEVRRAAVEAEAAGALLQMLLAAQVYY